VIRRPSGFGSTFRRRHIVLGLGLLLLPATAWAGVRVFDSQDMTLEFGMRMQPRFEYETSASDASGVAGRGVQGRRDFMIRRARLKMGGRMQGVRYGFEWKIDGTDQTGSTPTAAVENAWFQYPLSGPAFEFRAGLYDAPFSRDQLTSDSRQLAVDRGDVSAVPSSLGLVDNVVGFQFMGHTEDGKLMYVVGAYDNRTIAANHQDSPMFAGRLDVNLAASKDLKDLYQDTHFGDGHWLAFGIDGSIQNGIQNSLGADSSFSQKAAGVDGILDMPVGRTRVFVKGELNVIRSEWQTVDRQNNCTVKMLAGGVLLDDRIQPFIRFDQVRGDNWAKSGRRDVTYVGANYFQNGHSLKLSGDLRMQSGTGDPVDGVRFQAQMDF